MSSGGNAEDLFPGEDVVVYDARPVREPKPWHKPRKQWIRVNQWEAIAQQLIPRLKLTDRPFKYLTLPGEDLLDIRSIHKVVAGQKSTLKFLGFDAARKTAVNIANHEIGTLPYIDHASVLYGDKVESLTDVRSLAYERADSFSGFDAVNLDFCDSIGNRDSGTRGTPLETIQSILRIQTDSRLEPWVLFVTTRCNYDGVKESVRESFAKLILKNASNQRFKDAATQDPIHLRIGDNTEAIVAENADPMPHLYLFGIGFSKWLIGLAHSNWVVNQELVVAYRVHDDEHPDMLSLAYCFERVPSPPVVDGTGIAPSGNVRQARVRPEADLCIATIKNPQFRPSATIRIPHA